MAETRHFKALWVEEVEPDQFTRSVVERSVDDLPEGDVLVQVCYSSLNYKDALSAAGNRGVTRRYPHTPGIDAAGVVLESRDSAFKAGDEVLVIAPELGVSSPGGFGQMLRVPSAWLLPLPKGLTLRESMAYGTAGFTAAACLEKLQRMGVMPEQGEILVTGATGGVGIIAVGLLALEGYHAVAATGKLEQADLLRRLGAAEVVHRDEVNDSSGRPLLHARWAGVIDTVGGSFLSSAVRATKPNGVITACGNAASPDLPLNVFPFILRGVSLIGVDITRPAMQEREQLWRKLGSSWKLPLLDELVREVTLDQLNPEIDRILQGGQVGRVIVNLGSL